MNCRFYFFIFIFFYLTNCTTDTLQKYDISSGLDNNFVNKGFALVYSDNLLIEKKISKKIDNRSLIIFQKNLKKNTTVKITNILNKKVIIAKVGANSSYPSFNNSVISQRIASQLEINIDEPYIEIAAISSNSMFVAKSAKIYEEEKQVADKAPVESISINNLNKKKLIKKINKQIMFSYNIKIADFYYSKTAIAMIDRIKKETAIKDPKIKKISDKKYRVYVGPFSNINSLQKSFNDIDILKFENIEIIKND
jgi:hypothetical protein